jgi:hypothetical protein
VFWLLADITDSAFRFYVVCCGHRNSLRYRKAALAPGIACLSLKTMR